MPPWTRGRTALEGYSATQAPRSDPKQQPTLERRRSALARDGGSSYSKVRSHSLLLSVIRTTTILSVAVYYPTSLRDFLRNESEGDAAREVRPYL